MAIHTGPRKFVITVGGAAGGQQPSKIAKLASSKATLPSRLVGLREGLPAWPRLS